jgi:hypothetical protein
LAEPELNEPINTDAADMIKKSPRLYEQLARDAVVASRRLERGVTMFEDGIPVHFQENDTTNTEENVVKVNNENDKTNPAVKTAIPIKSKLLSFDQYYASWYCPV